MDLIDDPDFDKLVTRKLECDVAIRGLEAQHKIWTESKNKVRYQILERMEKIGVEKLDTPDANIYIQTNPKFRLINIDAVPIAFRAKALDIMLLRRLHESGSLPTEPEKCGFEFFEEAIIYVRKSQKRKGGKKKK